ncbi:MAG TPA: hypothetical protein PKX52_08810, partial [Methanomassiliicoccaceae archaeon]|nr:hypothetical protein [Methanomassiliicoccaceae archaeon]
TRMKGARFPLGAEEARRRLEGVSVGNRKVGELLDHVEFPIASPTDLLSAIKAQITNVPPHDEEWAIEAVRALEGARYPLTREEAKRRLKGTMAKGMDLSRLVDRLTFPCADPAQLLDQIENAIDGSIMY